MFASMSERSAAVDELLDSSNVYAEEPRRLALSNGKSGKLPLVSGWQRHSSRLLRPPDWCSLSLPLRRRLFFLAVLIAARLSWRRRLLCRSAY